MWRFDLIKESWSPVPVLSYTQPSSRSEFAHAIYLDEIMVFGGKGNTNTELYNDLYIYNVRSSEWNLVTANSSIIPAPRRGACMAVSDDFFLI
jgi:N-acetylneuraminic acid mutarotase